MGYALVTLFVSGKGIILSIGILCIWMHLSDFIQLLLLVLLCYQFLIR